MSTAQLPVSGSVNPLTSKKAILAAAKAEIAKGKAALKAQEQALKIEESALKGTHVSYKDSWEGKPTSKAVQGFMVENQYPGTHGDWYQNMLEGRAIASLASIAQNAVYAQKQAVKAERAIEQIEKAKATLAQVNQVEVEGFENGNQVVEINLPKTHTDLINLVCDGITAKMVKGTPKFQSAHIENLKPSQVKAMDSLVKMGYVTSTKADYYTMTESGLNLLQTSWAEVTQNYLDSVS